MYLVIHFFGGGSNMPAEMVISPVTICNSEKPACLIVYMATENTCSVQRKMEALIVGV
jgi:hypothetical protein